MKNLFHIVFQIHTLWKWGVERDRTLHMHDSWFMIDLACTVHKYTSEQVQCTGWQLASQNKGWQPISYKICQYQPFAVTKNLLRSACLFCKSLDISLMGREPSVQGSFWEKFALLHLEAWQKGLMIWDTFQKIQILGKPFKKRVSQLEYHMII